jgi:hypothetical protein
MNLRGMQRRADRLLQRKPAASDEDAERGEQRPKKSFAPISKWMGCIRWPTAADDADQQEDCWAARATDPVTSAAIPSARASAQLTDNETMTLRCVSPRRPTLGRVVTDLDSCPRFASPNREVLRETTSRRRARNPHPVLLKERRDTVLAPGAAQGAYSPIRSRSTPCLFAA